VALRNILVFDDEYEKRKVVFGEILRGLAEPIPKTFFTLAALDRGETAATVAPEDLIKLNPVAVILDLVIVRDQFNVPDVFQGLKLLSNLRQTPAFEKVPVFVVSDYSNDERLASRFLDEPTLAISGRFEWIKLASGTAEDPNDERRRFREAIEGVIKSSA
jgi:CheY-like chemotaxis protein